MTDLQGAWIYVVFLLVVVAVLDAVIQAFALHAALARGKIHAPETAGLGLLALWFPTVAAWLAIGITLGLQSDPLRCTTADVSAVWLGLLYPLTGWPPAYLAGRKGVRLPGWYWIVQLATAASLIVLGGFSCL